MNILLVAATTQEIEPLLAIFAFKGKKINFFNFEYSSHTVTPLVTGIGSMMTAYAIGRHKAEQKIDLAIQVGICGSFTDKFNIGDTVQITSDCFADLGAEEKDGSMLTTFDLGLTESLFPYTNGRLLPHKSDKFILPYPSAKAITVNMTSGTQATIDKWKNKYHPDVESMEGAAFFYATAIQDIPSVQMRTISNYVTVRNRNAWNIPLAIENLTRSTIELLESLHP